MGEVGREIVKGGFDMNVRGVRGGGRGGMDRGGGRGRGRGRGAGGMMRGRERGGGRRKAKRELLNMQLESKDIEVELLSNGMERRNLNQSIWDSKYVFLLFILLILQKSYGYPVENKRHF